MASKFFILCPTPNGAGQDICAHQDKLFALIRLQPAADQFISQQMEYRAEQDAPATPVDHY